MKNCVVFLKLHITFSASENLTIMLLIVTNFLLFHLSPCEPRNTTRGVITLCIFQPYSQRVTGGFFYAFLKHNSPSNYISGE